MLIISLHSTEEKENLILKFLGFFIGPIQFVMEVSLPGRVAQYFAFDCSHFFAITTFCNSRVRECLLRNFR
jgi:hypothetical protein